MVFEDRPWLVLGLVILTVFSKYDSSRTADANRVSYSEFVELVRDKKVRAVVIQDAGNTPEITVELSDGSKRKSTGWAADRACPLTLINSGVRENKPREEPSLLLGLLLNSLPMPLILGVGST